MTEPKWTPGPWKRAEYYNEWVVALGNGVARVSIDGRTVEERDANARLIAAAPELYEAAYELRIDAKIMAESALHAAKTDPRWEGVYEKLMVRIRAIEAAIAKARGE